MGRAFAVSIALTSLAVSGRRSAAQESAVWARLPQDSASMPAVISDFMTGAHRRHRNPLSPPETTQYGWLVGVWACIESTLDPRTGEVVRQAPALWAWRYTADGFGTEDLWYQSRDWYPFSVSLGRGLELRQLRVYEPATERWRIAMINSTGGQTPGAVFRTFSAVERDGQMIMTYDEPPPDRSQRLRISPVTEGSFVLEAEVSTDGERSWTVVSRIEARRLYGGEAGTG